MLIYGDSGTAPFAAVQHKSIGNRMKSSIRVKALKGVGRRLRRRRGSRVKKIGGKLKKVGKVKKIRKVKRRKSKKKKLNAKNIKFLKKLGLRVRKQ